MIQSYRVTLDINTDEHSAFQAWEQCMYRAKNFSPIVRASLYKVIRCELSHAVVLQEILMKADTIK